MTRQTGPTAKPAVLWMLLGAATGVHLAAVSAAHVLLGELRWQADTTHAAAATCAALFSFGIAWLMMSLERRGEGTPFNPALAAALVGSGVLQAFHAFSEVGNTFVWFQTAATLGGGLLVSAVWLPRHALGDPQRWPMRVFWGALLFGALSTAQSAELPRMLEGDAFTLGANAAMMGGGLLILAAAGRLAWEWRDTRSEDTSIFCVLTALIGVSALAMQQAGPWDGGWWAAQFLLLLTYGIALWFLGRRDLQLQAVARRVADELRDLNSTLEERVSGATAELEVALGMAESASRAKGEFLAKMSHEIRTPLNAVIGLTEVVLGTQLSEFQRDHLETVVGSGKGLLSVVNDILDISKIEAGKLELEHEPFDLEDAVCDTLKLMAIRAHSRGLELSCLIDPQVPRTIVGDRGRLRQVITNLVTNAINHTERGEVFVRIAMQRDTGMLQFAVIDSGIGFDRRELHRLWESFEQADSSSTRSRGGTGLGLSISRELVRMMGGSIRADSERGIGSTFSFTIRAELPEGGSERMERRDWYTEVLDGARVLIADDNSTNRTILGTLARTQGMRPVLAAGAEDAFELLAESEQGDDRIALVLCDLEMRGSDGYALAEHIRGDARFDRVSILFLTSAISDSDPERCRELRVAYRLMKPAKQSELFERMARALQSPGRVLEGAEEDPHASERAMAAEAQRPGTPGLEILLAEDSLPNRKLVMAMLDGGGHTIHVAENGVEAVEAFSERDCDLVLMDVQMPEMDGLQATAKIRAIEAETGGGHTPIIALTAHALRGDREKCLAAGMDEYVAKPIQREALMAAMAQVGVTRRRAVDWKRPLAQVEGNRELLRDITVAYITEIRENVEKLSEELARADWSELRRRAHSLTSALRMFGVEQGAEIAHRIEARATSGDAGGLAGMVEDLEDVGERVLPELAWYVESGWRGGDGDPPVRKGS